MRKSFAGLIAAGAAAVLMLSGFDSAMTVQELNEKTKAALAGVDKMAFALSGEADAVLSMSDKAQGSQTMDVPISGDVEVYSILYLDPLQFAVEVSYDADGMGEELSGGVAMAVMESEDGTGMAYLLDGTQDPAPQWQAQAVEAEKITEFKDMLRKAYQGDLTSLGTVGQTAGTDVDTAALIALAEQTSEKIMSQMQVEPGTDTYTMRATLTGDTFASLLSDLMTASGQTVDQTTLQIIQVIMSGLKMEISTEFYANTFLPVHFEADMSESDFSLLSSLLLSSMTGSDNSNASASVSVNRLRLSIDYEFNNVDPIELPQEALDAASNTAIGNPLGGMEGLNGQTAGSGTDIQNTTGSTQNTTGSIQNTTGSTQNTTGTTDTTQNTTGTTDTTQNTTDGTQSGAVQNPDGSYYLQFDNYDGSVNKVNVTAPSGMSLTYGDPSYVSFSDDMYTTDISFSVITGDSETDELESNLDTTYLAQDPDLTAVNRTKVMQTTLGNGTVVYYGSRSYESSEGRYGSTYAALKVGDTVVDVEISIRDDQYNYIEADEATVRTVCSLVSPAA